MLRTVSILAGLLVVANCLPPTINLFNAHQKVPTEQLHDYIRFNDFAISHSKQYANQDEVLLRFGNYLKNHEQVRQQQADEQSTGVYGETRFMDMSAEEIKNTYLSGLHQAGLRDFPQGKPCDKAVYNLTAPEEFLWTKSEGVVAKVKDQGSCGSCWAFSVIANIEGQMKLRLNKTVELAEQILLDCDHIDYGCGGGLPLDAYKEIQRFGGLETEKDYPYESRRDSCRLKKEEIVVKVTGSCQVAKDEEAIKHYLHHVGPLSIAVNANPLLFYHSGIHYPKYCSPEGLNHAVTLVGYGVQKGVPYWLVKNSWGKTWGESGFYRMYRGHNVCGMREYVTTAFVALP